MNAKDKVINKMGSSYSANENEAESEEDTSSSLEEEPISSSSSDTDSFIAKVTMDSQDLTIDAIETATSLLPPPPSIASRPVINLDQIEEVERELDYYEKVSLVFLLYDDHLAHIGLQNLILLGSNSQIHVITDWVQNFCKKTFCNDKLVEALCIIQNYAVLRKLGYTKEDVNSRFLPFSSNTSLCVNTVKKQLYHVCEKFGENDTKKFLQLVESDFGDKNLVFEKYNTAYLEMYLLHWITVKYITVKDVNNLIKLFKIMEMESVCKNLLCLTSIPVIDNCNDSTLVWSDCPLRPNRYSEPKRYTNISNSAGSSNISLASTSSRSLIQDNVREGLNESENYPVDPNNPGVCLIINQEHFYSEFEEKWKHLLPQPLASREGTEKDKERLVETFSKFGFSVETRDNKTHEQLLNEIRETVLAIREESSLIVCILSHGKEGVVYGVNSIPIEVKKIEEIMCNENRKNLKGKPKLLILQSCQGTQCQPVEDDEDCITTDGPVEPSTAHMLKFWATVPGYAAVRHKKEGTWFIKSLCDTIISHGQTRHFVDICTLVIDDVIKKRWKNKAMVPKKESTLSKFFYLPRMRHS